MRPYTTRAGGTSTLHNWYYKTIDNNSQLIWLIKLSDNFLLIDFLIYFDLLSYIISAYYTRVLCLFCMYAPSGHVTKIYPSRVYQSQTQIYPYFIQFNLAKSFLSLVLSRLFAYPIPFSNISCYIIISSIIQSYTIIQCNTFAYRRSMF